MGKASLGIICLYSRSLVTFFLRKNLGCSKTALIHGQLNTKESLRYLAAEPCA